MQVLEHLLSASAVQLETLCGIRILNARKVHYVLLIIIFLKESLNDLEFSSHIFSIFAYA